LPFLSFLTLWEVPVLPAELSTKAFISNEVIESDQTLQMPETPMPRESVSDAASSGVREKFEVQAETQFSEKFSPPLLTETSVRQTSPEKNAVLSLLPQTVNWALGVWSAGVLLLLLRLFVGLAANGFLVRRSRKFKDAALNELFSALCIELNLKNKTRLQCGEKTTMPIVCGVFRPVVLLPPVAKEWSRERQRIVLLHELAHVARRDCLTQMLAQMACSFYWFNPLVWIAARRLRVEREQACDDRVLSGGTKPSEYAHHLLEIARLMQEERSIFEWSQTSSVAMARQSQLEGRLLAILREENKFGAASRAATAGLVALVCFLLVSLAVVRPTAINAQKSSTSEAASSEEKDKTEMSTLDSLLEVGLKSESDTVFQSSATDKAVIKQVGDHISNGNLTEQAVNDKQIDNNVEPSMKPNSKDDFGNIISETVEQQIAQSIPTPELIPLPANVEANPFNNAEYRQESKPQIQEKSGDFIDEMASVGFTNLSVDDLIMLKTHRVTSDFVKGLRAQGFNNLTPKMVADFRIFNITRAYVDALSAAGYKGVTLEELTDARFNKVTPEFIKEIQNAGYGSLSIGQMIEFKFHRITPEFVRSARSRLGDLTPKQLVSLKISGGLNAVKDKKRDTE
jgi:beta-lactamase regulating signal transducer with metallopeptidase domain